jgi:hypothetical protein
MKRIPTEFRVATVAAIVVCSLASFLWMNGDTYMGDGYLFGDKVYALGAPLTSLMWIFVHHFGPLTTGDNLWAIPAMDILVVLQYAIWALAIFGARKAFFTWTK